MYPAALDIGIPADAFWDMSLREVYDRFESYRRTCERKNKDKLSRDFILAEAISSRICYFFSTEESRSEDMILQPWDVDPDVFSMEKKRAEKEKRIRELAEYKAKVMNWANGVNATRARLEDGD